MNTHTHLLLLVLKLKYSLTCLFLFPLAYCKRKRFHEDVIEKKKVKKEKNQVTGQEKRKEGKKQRNIIVSYG